MLLYCCSFVVLSVSSEILLFCSSFTKTKVEVVKTLQTAVSHLKILCKRFTYQFLMFREAYSVVQFFFTLYSSVSIVENYFLVHRLQIFKISLSGNYLTLDPCIASYFIPFKNGRKYDSKFSQLLLLFGSKASLLLLRWSSVIVWVRVVLKRTVVVDMNFR